ncbi:hypothetical protein Fcan01_05830 [Folsomia candida]|uniref:Uncharacterized protein n=1 Tax=Folsomia candida TaxID=158441 RepID=A0A226EQY4_FOLCA|nr:hypothetical protein Fcan01_05830 [Folsomia candida]
MKNMANLTGGGLATAKSKQRNGYRKAIKILDLNLNLGRTSFAATCVALLLLLTTRDGECSIGDEILEADKPKSKQNCQDQGIRPKFYYRIIQEACSGGQKVQVEAKERTGWSFACLDCTTFRRTWKTIDWNETEIGSRVGK